LPGDLQTSYGGHNQPGAVTTWSMVLVMHGYESQGGLGAKGWANPERKEVYVLRWANGSYVLMNGGAGKSSLRFRKVLQSATSFCLKTIVLEHRRPQRNWRNQGLGQSNRYRRDGKRWRPSLPVDSRPTACAEWGGAWAVSCFANWPKKNLEKSRMHCGPANKPRHFGDCD